MTIGIRRVVTGHDERGRAMVHIDDGIPNSSSGRAGVTSCVAWSTKGFPVSNEGNIDPSQAVYKTTLENGSIFRIVRYEPGVLPRNHRTDSIDYAVVISGKIDMELDDGLSVTLQAGDVLVQRGTVHNWNNRYGEDCIIAFVLICAKPVSIDGALLSAHG
jgi:quercetin dioxygenase-like cupin family protein